MSNLINAEGQTEEAKGKKVKEGFQDPAGALPSVEHIDQSDLNFRAQGDVSDRIQNRATKKARSSSTTSQVTKGNIQEPDIPNQSVYPKNRVIKTSSGHLIELDNTPGRERIHVRHRSGTKVEMRPNGSIKIISAKDRYSAIAGDEELVVRGNTNVVLESDATVRIEGDMELQIDGDLKTLVQGDHSLEVQGSLTERVHGDVTRTYTGDYLRDVRGSVTERNLSNYLCWNVGTYKVNVGDAYEVTTESTMKIISDDDLTMECEGGFIDLKTPESYIISGINYAVNFHAEENFYGEEVHVSTGYANDWHGDLEGTAVKAGWATTAGSAPMGSSSPTSPSATGPTTAENSPDSTLEAVDVADTSDGYISEIDRSTYYENKYNKRKLNTMEVWSRMNNANLRYDSTWMQDQVDYGAILDSATSSSAPVAARSFSINNNRLGVGFTKIGNKFIQDRGFKLEVPNKPIIDVIPEAIPIVTGKRSCRNRG